MNTNDTINAAHAAAIHMLESNSFISADDTVCAIRTVSGNVYTGASHSAPNGAPIHAEIEAVQSMLASGESAIVELVLIGTQSRMQLLPCNNCISYILSLAPENTNCFILMPDRAVNINEISMVAFHGGAAPEPPAFNGGASLNYAAHTGGTAFHAVAPEIPHGIDETAPVSVNTGSASSDLLKNKVSSLLSVADDDDDDEEEETEQPKKKKRFGFFRK